MRPNIILVFALSLSCIYLVACNSNASPEQKTLSQPFIIDTAHKPYKYAPLYTDYGTKNFNYALFGKIPVGITVNVIDFDNGKVYSLKTKVNKKEIDDCIGEYSFTRFVNTPIELSESGGNNAPRYKGIVAMIGDKALAYQEMNHEKVDDSKIVKELAEKVSHSDFIGKLSKEAVEKIKSTSPGVFKIAIPGVEAYLVEYPDSTFGTSRFFSIDAKVYLLNEMLSPLGHEQPVIYQLGENYFIHTGRGISGSSNIEIWEIRKDGLRKEYFFEAC